MSSFLQRLRYYFLILFDRQTPWYVKLILTAGLLYSLPAFCTLLFLWIFLPIRSRFLAGWTTWQLLHLLLPWH
jgi:hypothetical protein